METTFDRFINNDPHERELFNKEYNDFLLSELTMEKMEEEHISIKSLPKKAGVSPVAKVV